MSYTVDVEVILKPGIVASMEVFYEVVSFGYCGSFDEPGEANEYQFLGLEVNSITRLGKAHRVWTKTGEELDAQGWHDAVCELARPLLDGGDYEEEWMELADRDNET